MWSLWRLTIVWPKSIFVVIQPLRTGSGRSHDPRITQDTEEEKKLPFLPSSFLFAVSLSHSRVELLWCFSCFCYQRSCVRVSLQTDKDVKKTKIYIFGKSFLFELHAELHGVILPVKLWIAPYWRDVLSVCFMHTWIYIYIYGGCILFYFWFW